MSSLKSALIAGITTLALAASLSGLAYARMGHGTDKEGRCCRGTGASHSAQVKVLRDSAAALSASNPDLAGGLKELADTKEEKMKKWQERKTQNEATVKLLRDSSAALKAPNPALAKELQKMSEMKCMGMEGAGDKICPE